MAVSRPGNKPARCGVLPDMLESLAKELRSRRLITQRAPYRRSDEPYLAPAAALALGA